MPDRGTRHAARGRGARDAATGRSVAVYGATGHTGRFVVAELERRGMAPIAVARNGAKLEAEGYADRGIAVRTASVDAPDSLGRAFEGAAAVINCAGPFLDTADAVASAALRAGIHYLDVTAEQASARATFEAFDVRAREAGVVVIPAMGFYGGFADLLVTAVMDGRTAADEIGIAIALDRWHPTRGTRRTGERNTAPRLVIADGRLTPLPQPAPEMSWAFPAPFGRESVVEVPLSEAIVIARHLETAELHTWINQRAIRDIRDESTPPPAPADASGRSAQRFLVEAVVRNRDDARRIVARGRDIYAFSAPLVGEAVERILAGATRGFGALAPGAAFDASAFLHALAPDHLIFEVTAG
ncbi:MAG: saccharopine dehydrogenase family protein [Gemmatimonadota bacterium]